MINLHTEMQFNITGTEEDIERVVSNDTASGRGGDLHHRHVTGLCHGRFQADDAVTVTVMTVNVVPKTQPTQPKPIPEKVVKEAVKAANEAAAKSKAKTTTASKTTPKK